jgi:hypothetical protein
MDTDIRVLGDTDLDEVVLVRVGEGPAVVAVDGPDPP